MSFDCSGQPTRPPTAEVKDLRANLGVCLLPVCVVARQDIVDGDPISVPGRDDHGELTGASEGL
jgi:hypothetical protein